MRPLTVDTLLAALRAKGHPVFDKGDYNLNIVGLRCTPGVPNSFDDRVALLYKVDGEWVLRSFPATTDPGLYWLQHPQRVDGTATVIPGHYRSCWTLGQHHAGTPGAYDALVQRAAGVFRVWRNGAVFTDAAGLNCHHAGTASTVVDKWSAGCQVLARMADWYEFLGVVKLAAIRWGLTFSYTLIEWPA